MLQFVLAAGLGSAFFVPTHAGQQPVGVSMALPDWIGEWYGTPQKISEAELNQLAPDTTFARRVYSNPRGDEILASIVLAGEDPDNSIHRPERCLPAQGWTIVDSKTVAVSGASLPGGQLKVTRLRNQQKFRTEQGRAVTVSNLNYYWFVGYNHITPSHIDRAITDIRDRLFNGYNQRWAYITVASNVTGGLQVFGRSESETDKMIQQFIAQFYPTIVRTNEKSVATANQVGPHS